MSTILGNPMVMGPGGTGKLKFTYTGDYTEREDGVVELRSSGTLVFLNKAVIDLFLVGGGGGGGSSVGSGNNSRYHGCGGGAGGYTKTIKNKKVYGTVNVSIGAGGSAGNSGGSTTFGSEVALGGAGGANINTSSSGYGSNGGNGGSGGGAGLPSMASGTWSIAGGSDGNNGNMPKGTGLSISPGTGQGSTTREFGEITGKLYAGGGGGGYGSSSKAPGQNVNTSGGNGGGGNGTVIQLGTIIQPSTAGEANTGGGGGGGGRGLPATSNQIGASGGSGIVCFREAQELPELAGTWVLNERLYAPAFGPSATGKQTSQAVTFTAGSDTFTSFVFYWPSVNDNNMYYQNSAKTTVIYNFISNTYYSGVIKTITFPVGATASDEFREWLASNATKQ